MTTVYITAWESAAEVALGDPIQYTAATIDGANSNPIIGDGKKRRRVRLHPLVNCWIKYGAAPVATGSGDSIALGANNPEYFDIEAGYVVTAITRA